MLWPHPGSRLGSTRGQLRAKCVWPFSAIARQGTQGVGQPHKNQKEIIRRLEDFFEERRLGHRHTQQDILPLTVIPQGPWHTGQMVKAACIESNRTLLETNHVIPGKL